MTAGAMFPVLRGAQPGRAKRDERARGGAVEAVDGLGQVEHIPDLQEWFNQIRELGAKHGFAPTAKE